MSDLVARTDGPGGRLIGRMVRNCFECQRMGSTCRGCDVTETGRGQFVRREETRERNPAEHQRKTAGKTRSHGTVDKRYRRGPEDSRASGGIAAERVQAGS